MVIQNESGMVRVTVTLEPEDVRLLDALARFEGLNRSSELRALLQVVRPTLTQLVGTFARAETQRALLDEALVSATMSELESVRPEAEDLGRRMLGMLAKLEGAAAAAAGDETDGNAPASNTGATK